MASRRRAALTHCDLAIGGKRSREHFPNRIGGVQGPVWTKALSSVHGICTDMNPIIAANLSHRLRGRPQRFLTVTCHPPRKKKVLGSDLLPHTSRCLVSRQWPRIDPKSPPTEKKTLVSKVFLERVVALAGNFQLITSTGTGTTIELHVPGKTRFFTVNPAKCGQPPRDF